MLLCLPNEMTKPERDCAYQNQHLSSGNDSNLSALFEPSRLFRCVCIAIYLACVCISPLPLFGQASVIEQRLNDLRQIAQPPPLAELPNDQTALPPGWLGVASWNIQVGGVSVSTSALRPPMVRSALERLFGGSYQILAAQEISASANAEILRGLLPGGAGNWVAFSPTPPTHRTTASGCERT
jgi:hypothetical protein